MPVRLHFEFATLPGGLRSRIATAAVKAAVEPIAAQSPNLSAMMPADNAPIA
jgi:hypothetical protein